MQGFTGKVQTKIMTFKLQRKKSITNAVLITPSTYKYETSTAKNIKEIL